MNVLGVETSCDETAAAVVRNGRVVLSSVVASQFSTHKPYRGVVPELASRAHIENVNRVIEQAMADAHLDFDDLDGMAVTDGPGLVGSLLVGKMAAQTLAAAPPATLFGVDHIEGHLLSALISHPRLVPPFLALIVSGGHTELIDVDGSDVTDASATRATTRPAKPTTRWPRCWASTSRAGPPSTNWPEKDTRGVLIRPGLAEGNARLFLQRSENRRPV